jgi:sporulation protein YlmC with PRC-barrel domain
MRNLLPTAALAAAVSCLALTPSLAQVQAEVQPRQGAAQQSQGAFQYVPAQQPNEWAANTLIGKAIENHQGERLGDVNNVIVNEKGDVVAVTIGVGGFLGIGEKDVGVPYDAIEFRLKTDRTAATTPRGTQTQTGQTGTQTQTGQVEPRQTDPATTPRAEDRNWNFAADQRNDVVLVLNATRAQLEAAPEYVWIDDRRGRTG